jgi:hypothetical protein
MERKLRREKQRKKRKRKTRKHRRNLTIDKKTYKKN